MLGSMISKIFGSKSDKDIKALMPKVQEINSIYDTLSSMTDDELISEYKSLREDLKHKIDSKKQELLDNNEDVESIDESLNNLETDFLNRNLVKVFAIVKDASRRLCGKQIIVMDQKLEWNMIHYDEQLIGGIVFNKCNVAEMKTG